MLESYIRFADKLNGIIGKSVAWLAGGLVLLVVIDVALRNIFNYSDALLYELEWHFFAFIFLFGAGYTLRDDRHVRVDVFYAKFSARQQAWVNLTGCIFFLFPFCLVGIYASLPYVESSFLMNESSPDPGGLPARWITKSAIPAGLFFLFLQGIALAFRSLLTIRE